MMFGNLESRLGNRSDILQYFMSDLKKYVKALGKEIHLDIA